MIDCKKLTIKLRGITDLVKELDQKIEQFNNLKNSVGNKEKTEFLFDIYRARKLVKDKIQNIRDRIKAEAFLESLPEERIERMSIKRGNFRGSIPLVKSLKQAGNNVPRLISHALSNCGIRFLEKEVVDDFVAVYVRDLGFDNLVSVLSRADIEEIFKKAERFGLKLCLPEIAPQLLLQHEPLPAPNYHIAMEPLKSANSIFEVSSESSIDLSSIHWGYHGSHRFVFRLP